VEKSRPATPLTAPSPAGSWCRTRRARPGARPSRKPPGGSPPRTRPIWGWWHLLGGGTDGRGAGGCARLPPPFPPRAFRPRREWPRLAGARRTPRRRPSRRSRPTVHQAEEDSGKRARLSRDTTILVGRSSCLRDLFRGVSGEVVEEEHDAFPFMHRPPWRGPRSDRSGWNDRRGVRGLRLVSAASGAAAAQAFPGSEVSAVDRLWRG